MLGAKYLQCGATFYIAIAPSYIHCSTITKSLGTDRKLRNAALSAASAQPQHPALLGAKAPSLRARPCCPIGSASITQRPTGAQSTSAELRRLR